MWVGDCMSAFPFGSVFLGVIVFGLGLTIGLAVRFRQSMPPAERTRRWTH